MIEKRAVERIVSQVASESEQTGGSSGGLLGLGQSSDLTARPSASVELVGQSADVSVDVTVAYPIPIRQVTNRLRERIRTRVHELTGIDVNRVDVTVTALHRATSSVRRLQ